MKPLSYTVVSALALAAAATPASAQNRAEPESPSPTERTLMERIEKQDAEISALKEQLHEVSTVLSSRMSDVEATTGDGKVTMKSPTPRFESSNADFSAAIVGTLQPEVAFYGQSGMGTAAAHLNNGTNVRRAQLGIQGTAFGNFSYQLVFDGAASGGVASSIRDALVSYNGFRPFTITIGNQKTQSGMEPTTSGRSNALTFMERGLPSVLAMANGIRGLGVRVSTGSDHYSASIGVFGDDINNAGITSPYAEGWGVHGRLTLAPVNKKARLVHLGISGYRRDPGTIAPTATDPEKSQLRYRAQPEIAVDATRLVDTGVLTNVHRYSYLGLEAAGMYGPFSVQGEYAKSWVDQTGGKTGLNFNAAYVSASYFLTGESRVYDARNGVFTRTSPRHNFRTSGGIGAVEIAARWSRIDLDSHSNALAQGGVRGGILTDYTLGLNWYLNPYLRVMLDYVHADADKRSAANVDQGTKANIVALRLHQEW